MAYALRRISAYNAGRDSDALALKYQYMRENAFVFLRATCHLFYERLPDAAVLRRAPLSWVCGDLHLQNFGSYKADNRQVYFDINDFDEGALAPCTWDLVRFLASVLVGAQSLRVKPREADTLCRTFLDAYADALASGKARWVERETADGLVRDLLDGLRSRSRKDFLKQRTLLKKGKRVIRLDGARALAISDKKRERILRFMRDFARAQPDPDFYQVVDVARRVAGTGSLGIDRSVILIEGKGSPNGNYLLDMKEALPSSLAPHLKTQPLHASTHAHRIVAIQRRMQAISMAFLHPVVVGKKSYVLRGLQPTQDRVALAQWDGKLARLEYVVAVMGKIAASAQLRSGGRDGSATIDELIDFGQQTKWRKQLLEVSRHCAAQAEKDWRVYARAYDDGEFGQPVRA